MKWYVIMCLMLMLWMITWSASNKTMPLYSSDYVIRKVSSSFYHKISHSSDRLRIDLLGENYVVYTVYV